jgi:hypothetical protein
MLPTRRLAFKKSGFLERPDGILLKAVLKPCFKVKAHSERTIITLRSPPNMKIQGRRARRPAPPSRYFWWGGRLWPPLGCLGKRVFSYKEKNLVISRTYTLRGAQGDRKVKF